MLAAAGFPGEAEWRAGRYEAAEPLLRETVERNPENLDAILTLTELYLGWSDAGRAVPMGERAVALADERLAAGAIEKPVAARAHLRLAQAQTLRALRASSARSLLLTRGIRSESERAIELDPKNVEARAGLVTFLTNVPALGGGSLPEAAKQAEALAALDPARGLRALSIARFKAGEEAAAFAALDRLTARDPAQAHLGRGWLYFKKEQPERVVAEMNALQRDLPPAGSGSASGDPARARTRALVLTEGGQLLTDAGRPERALPLLAAAEAADATWMRAAWETGRAAALAKRDLPRGEAALRRYLAVETAPQQPSHASAHAWLGAIREAQGRRDEARDEYKEAARLEPDNDEYRASLRRLSG